MLPPLRSRHYFRRYAFRCISFSSFDTPLLMMLLRCFRYFTIFATLIATSPLFAEGHSFGLRLFSPPSLPLMFRLALPLSISSSITSCGQVNQGNGNDGMPAAPPLSCCRHYACATPLMLIERAEILSCWLAATPPLTVYAAATYAAAAPLLLLMSR